MRKNRSANIQAKIICYKRVLVVIYVKVAERTNMFRFFCEMNPCGLIYNMMMTAVPKEGEIVIDIILVPDGHICIIQDNRLLDDRW